MSNVSLSINGVQYEVPSELTVLEAARTVGIDIPTLCFLKDINEVGACRVRSEERRVWQVFSSRWSPDH